MREHAEHFVKTVVARQEDFSLEEKAHVERTFISAITAVLETSKDGTLTLEDVIDAHELCVKVVHYKRMEQLNN